MGIVRSRWLRSEPSASEITPLPIYQDRRNLVRQLAMGASSLALSAWLPAGAQTQGTRPGKLAPLSAQPTRVAGALALDKPTTFGLVTSYNNFYEFGTDKEDPAGAAQALVTRPWTLEIDGLVKKPLKLGLDDLLKVAALEERVYRLRCVEGWSMVIPWVGYSLSELLKRAEPLGSAKFVAFSSLADPKTMPGVASRVLDWPYAEGLRLDEAMHPLTLLTLGMYGEVLPKQNGAPVRIVVPWKYGFKSAKSIVRIRVTETQPATAWGRAAPQEYGFYSNVNPDVDHPRWSQATERRIGEDGLLARRRKTLMFNGYEAQVGQLYAGMDLKKFY